MQEELKSMHGNDVWNLADLSDDLKPIGYKCKTKRDSMGNVERFKAKLIAIMN